MDEIERIKDLMFRMGEYLPKTQYLKENKGLLSEAHENIDTLLATRYKDIDKDTAMKLLLFDPTYQKGTLVKGEYPNPSKKAGNYGVWILDRYLNGEITLDDGDKVYKTLNVFKNIGKKLKNSNINAYSSFQELYNEVLPFINGEKNMNTHSAMVDKYRHIPDTEIPYEDDFWIVVTPFTEEASCQVGGGTKWCTASRKAENRFWYYAVHAPLFVIISKSENSVKYQYNKWSKEFKDVQNEKANMDSVGLSPKLLKWLKDGADEYKKKYIQKIKPYKKQYFQQIEQRLANGENPEDIFDSVGEFVNGFAIVYLNEIGLNFLKTDRTLLWHGDTWFDDAYDFYNGFARVWINGKKCYLTQNGDLISKEQYIQQIEQRLANGENPEDIFDEVGKFVDGYAKVFSKDKGWNYLKTDGTLLWHDDTWFNDAWDFTNGFAIIYLYGKGYNFINPNGTLLWSDDTWFDSCGNFKNGFAKVGYKYMLYNLDTEGLLHKIE